VNMLPKVEGALLLALLVARPISGDCLGKMQKQIADLDACVVVIGQHQLGKALGPNFDGIATLLMSCASGDTPRRAL